MDATPDDFKTLFNGTIGIKVLENIKQFCRANETTADLNNVYATYMAEGRREVWLAIEQMLNYEPPEDIEEVNDYDN